MRFSQILVVALVAAVAYFALKKVGIFTSKPTTSPTSGTNPTVKKDDFQAAADDVASIFNSATKLFGGPPAQTAPNTM